MGAFFEKELVGLDTVDGFAANTVLQNVKRRLHGLQMVGDSVMVRVGISTKGPQQATRK
jgi:hypothetical protein